MLASNQIIEAKPIRLVDEFGAEAICLEWNLIKR
jgi:hypothetical protein